MYHLISHILSSLVIVIVAENGRLGHIERMAQRFSELTMAHIGEVKVTVTSVIVSLKSLY